MKILKNLFVFIGISAFLMAGCSNDPTANATESDGAKITVEKHIEEGKFEPFKEITDSESVQKVEGILSSTDWENAEVSMASLPYVKFSLEEVEQADSDVPVYYLWVSPNKDKVELVIEGEGKYVQLNHRDSEDLFEAVTEENLPDTN